MKFTLSWLKTHLDTEASVERIATTLSAIGLEVEGVEDRAAALGAFRIAHVIEAKQHPNADRLRVCRVDAGDGRVLNVVCGAPNARTGMKGVVALPGAFIPGTGITLKAGAIRGEASEAMLLSAREMGLGEDHSGIVDLPEDAPLGVPYVTWAGLDDPVIEIAVTPNRGDALSVRGIARDLAAAGLGTLKPWAPAPVPVTYQSPVRWETETQACPFVLGRHFRGVRNGPSPEWLRRRLESIGLRPISALVDITNFFTFDIGRPLHVFDAAKLRGGVLTMRQGRGETFAGLHGKEVTAGEADTVIADASGALALAGIVGGESTGCSEATTEVFLEVALFDPVAIANSGRRLGIQTDARYRFERGIDAGLMEAATEAATRMILDLCGGEASEVVRAGAEPAWHRTATLHFSRLASFGGHDVPADEAATILDRLGFTARARDGEKLIVAVPSWRNDCAGEPDPQAEYDLLEEVFRIIGLDTIAPAPLPPLTDAEGRARVVPPVAVTPAMGRAIAARRVLAGRGMVEAVTFSFMARDIAALFGGGDAARMLANPIASDLDAMRPSIIPNLALAAARNAARGLPDVAFFETGPVFSGGEPGQQTLAATGLRAGAMPRHWATASRTPDAMDAKADALAILSALGMNLDAVQVTADAPAWFHPGRSGTLRFGPKVVLGTFGELHPRVLTALDLAGPVAAFELDLLAVPEAKRKRRGNPTLPAFQPLVRDFAFVVDEAVAADAVLRAAKGAERSLVEHVALFDVFRGPAIGEGKKSLAIAVTLQPRDKTLTEAEIDAVGQKVVAAVAKATGAVLRS
jgi:phenylalanyl-tRNA synthetase beta chain